MQGKRKILAILDDLFFRVKIESAARFAGMAVEFSSDEHDAMEKAKHQQPMLVILDLNANSVHPLKLIEKLKSTDETRSISLIGFVSHVQGDLKQKAQESGCNMVLARSAFSQNLPQILKRHASLLSQAV